MILALLKKYKWYMLAMFILYSGISLWLFIATDSPQAVPFEYQVH